MLCYGGRFWLGFVKTSGVEGVGVIICVCAGVIWMRKWLKKSIGAEYDAKRNRKEKRKLHRKGAFQNL
jgi:H+/gluconate symporter-like permease